MLVHDEGEDLDAWRPLLPELLALDVTVLAFDLRGHGASDDPWDESKLVSDVLAALGLAGREPLVVGAGLGATAALVAAGSREVGALVLLSPRTELAGHDREALRESAAPKLILAGSEDPLVEEAQELHRLSIGWAVLQMPPVAERGTALLRSEWGELVRENVGGFLADYV